MTENVLQFANRLKADALKAPVLLGFEGTPVHGRFQAWSAGLSKIVGEMLTSTGSGRAQWHLSLKLVPPRSTEQEWYQMGALLAAFKVPPEVVKTQDALIRQSPTATYHWYF